jgi:hypothetical protein
MFWYLKEIREWLEECKIRERTIVKLSAAMCQIKSFRALIEWSLSQLKGIWFIWLCAVFSKSLHDYKIMNIMNSDYLHWTF